MTDNQHEEIKEDKHPVEIKVNKKPVKMPHHKANGLKIKEEAINQGVKIELDFVLSRIIKPGETQVIPDHETVELHKEEGFVAVGGDDNS